MDIVDQQRDATALRHPHSSQRVRHLIGGLIDFTEGPLLISSLQRYTALILRCTALDEFKISRACCHFPPNF